MFFLLHAKYKWGHPPPNPIWMDELCEQLKLNRLIGTLLYNRGIRSETEALQFIRTSSQPFHDPFLLHGMKEAVARIELARERKEHVVIYGDYDADGVCSTALVVFLMQTLGIRYETYIPHRIKEGYGLHNHVIDWAHDKGVTLIITVDNGIRAIEQVAYAHRLGIEVIITDHHEPSEHLPDAYTIVNPKIPCCSYPFLHLAGVGIVLKLAQAFIHTVPPEWMAIAAIGTIADVVPLQGENRKIVQCGMEALRHVPNKGIAQLLHRSGIQLDRITATDIAFFIAPRLNASGRMDHAIKSLDLITAPSILKAEQMAAELHLLNEQRQQLVHTIMEKAEQQFSFQRKEQLPPIIVLADEGWSVAVAGIVAAKMVERYYRPTVILEIDSATHLCRGSARSTPTLDIVQALASVSDLLDHYGGHCAAAGLTLHYDQLAAFVERIHIYANQRLIEQSLQPFQCTDGQYTIAQLSVEVIEQIDVLQPFGMENPLPCVIIRKAYVQQAYPMGAKQQHFKMVLEQDSYQLDAVLFHKGHLAPYITPGTIIDVMGEIGVNEWRGAKKVQLIVRDFCVTTAQVFDFRKKDHSLDVMEQFLRTLYPYPMNDEANIAAVSERDDPFLQQMKATDCVVWSYDGIAGVTSLSSSHCATVYEQVETLLILHVPNTLNQLTELFKVLINVKNVILWLKSEDATHSLREPSRQYFQQIYKKMVALTNYPLQKNVLIQQLMHHFQCSQHRMTAMIEVFEELGFIHCEKGFMTIERHPQKKELTSSEKYIQLQHKVQTEKIFLEEQNHECNKQLLHMLEHKHVLC